MSRLVAILGVVWGSACSSPERIGVFASPLAPSGWPDDLSSYVAQRNDCVGPWMPTSNEPAATCDDWPTDALERPNTADGTGDFPWVDIERTLIGSDGTFVYGALDLRDIESGAGLTGDYGIELDADVSIYFAGDFFVNVKNASQLLPADGTWRQVDSELWEDQSGDVGGPGCNDGQGNNCINAQGPSGGINGYDTLIWSSGDADPGVYARILATDETVLEVAVDLQLIGSPTTVSARGWASTGGIPFGDMNAHDRFSSGQYGAWPSSGEVSEIDNDGGLDPGLQITLNYAVLVTPAQQSATVCAGAGGIYPVQIQNSSAVQSDLFDLHVASSEGWTVELWDSANTTLIAADTDGDGVWDTLNNPSFDTDADGSPDTGTLSPQQTSDFTVRVIVPPGEGAGTSDAGVLTATSDTDAAIAATGDMATTVSDPANCVAVCGNNILEVGEGCDDNNTAPGDGCDANCFIEDDEPCNATAPGLTGADSCAGGFCVGGTCDSDGDGDSFPSLDDCDDTNDTIYPGAPEICNNVDDDCDSDPNDDGADEAWFNQPCDGPDSDLCQEGVYQCVSGGQTCGDATADDIEIPDDGIDTDCNGAELCYVDADDDGVRLDDVTVMSSSDLDCTDPGEGSASDPFGDTSDTNPNECRDTDGDGCDDCANTGANESGGDPADDGADTDSDGFCDLGDTDDDNDGVLDSDDSAPLNPDLCEDIDTDGCDDCAVGTDNFGPLADNNPDNDGPDNDADGQCDPIDTDGDGVLDSQDNDPNDPNVCQDSDSDSCDDCTNTGSNGSGGDPSNDGTDTDADGQCDSGDADDDNDGVVDGSDNAPNNPDSCEDADNDGCDDCSSGDDDFGPNPDNLPSDDGTDTDSDGLCDGGDPDDDNDGVADGVDGAPLDPNICADADSDGCDDCAIGTDDFGPMPDNQPANDGTDTDMDSVCDSGDPDDDNDGVSDTLDSQPLNPNVCEDVDSDGCDDCAVGTDDFGPMPDNDPSNDGPDMDNDGQCDGNQDSDGDGVNDDMDSAPNDPNICRDADGDSCDDCAVTGADGSGGDTSNDGSDHDSDGVCDAGDGDDDNDGILDSVEGNADSDGDGIIDSLDLDSDNDGISDVVESGASCPITLSMCASDVDAAGIPVGGGTGPVDTDNDGTANYLDVDSDDDGISDLVEAGTVCTPNAQDDRCVGIDVDGDGLVADVDGTMGTGGVGTEPINSDGDGLPDYIDEDSDNDDLPDAQEGSDDTDGDGLADYRDTDSNNDGYLDGRSLAGGGSCSSGSGMGLALGLTILFLVLARRRNTLWVTAALLFVVPKLGHAQEGVSVERFSLATDRAGILDVESAAVAGAWSYELSSWFSYSNDSFVVYQNVDGDMTRSGSLVGNRYGTSLMGSAALFGWLQIAVEMPLVISQTGDNSAALAMPTEGKSFGISDLRVALKGRLLHQAAYGVDLSVWLSGNIPIASSDGYFGESSGTLDPGILLGRTFGNRVRVAANFGYRVRENQMIADLQVRDEIYFKAGIAIRAMDSLEVQASAAVATAAAAPFGQSNENYFEPKLGAAYRLGGAEVFAAAGVGMARGYGTPDWRALAGVRVGRYKPQPVGRTTGASGGQDRDRDGVADADDKCPNEAENKNGIQDDDGCPETTGDADDDGLNDLVDKCPDEKEDTDGFEDDDGCPDTDNDDDGVADNEDLCPLIPGPAAAGGCSGKDRDKDQVPDMIDNCPDVKGTAANSGCKTAQLAQLSKGQIELKGRLGFADKKSIVRVGDHPALRNIAHILMAHPEIREVEIQAYVKGAGENSADLTLSQSRADAVLQFLVTEGIDPGRLKAVGYGSKSADKVEFKIVTAFE